MTFKAGFDLGEALDLVTLCALIEGHASLPQPAHWTIVYDSPGISLFTEKWQLWRNSEGAFAIAVRGTVPDPGSIAEDLISFLAQAAGTVTVGRNGLTTNSPPIRSRACKPDLRSARFCFSRILPTAFLRNFRPPFRKAARSI